MGFNPGLSDFRNSQAPAFPHPTQPQRQEEVVGCTDGKWERKQELRGKENERNTLRDDILC